MAINYALLAITGILSLVNIISLVRGQGWLGHRCFSGVIAMVLFVLVLIATLMGINYSTFKIMIETGTFF